MSIQGSEKRFQQGQAQVHDLPSWKYDRAVFLMRIVLIGDYLQVVLYLEKKRSCGFRVS